jgi:hypothetical protein
VAGGADDAVVGVWVADCVGAVEAVAEGFWLLVVGDDAAVWFMNFGPMKNAPRRPSTTTAATANTNAKPRRLDSTVALERWTPWRLGLSGTSSNSSRG